MLTISGTRSSQRTEGSDEADEQKHGGGLRLVERSHGTFVRRLRLPQGLDVDGGWLA